MEWRSPPKQNQTQNACNVNKTRSTETPQNHPVFIPPTILDLVRVNLAYSQHKFPTEIWLSIISKLDVYSLFSLTRVATFFKKKLLGYYSNVWPLLWKKNFSGITPPATVTRETFVNEFTKLRGEWQWSKGDRNFVMLLLSNGQFELHVTILEAVLCDEQFGSKPL